MLYRRRLELDIEETRPDLDILRHAAKELKAATRFKHVLKVHIYFPTLVTVGLTSRCRLSLPSATRSTGRISVEMHEASTSTL